METSQIELKKLSKQKLIEMIHEYKESISIHEECTDILRLDLQRR